MPSRLSDTEFCGPPQRRGQHETSVDLAGVGVSGGSPLVGVLASQSEPRAALGNPSGEARFLLTANSIVMALSPCATLFNEAIRRS